MYNLKKYEGETVFPMSEIMAISSLLSVGAFQKKWCFAKKTQRNHWHVVKVGENIVQLRCQETSSECCSCYYNGKSSRARDLGSCTNLILQKECSAVILFQCQGIFTCRMHQPLTNYFNLEWKTVIWTVVGKLKP